MILRGCFISAAAVRLLFRSFRLPDTPPDRSDHSPDFLLVVVFFLIILIRQILCHLIDEFGHADAVLDGLIQHEEDLRSIPEVDLLRELGPDKALRAL